MTEPDRHGMADGEIVAVVGNASSPVVALFTALAARGGVLAPFAAARVKGYCPRSCSCSAEPVRRLAPGERCGAGRWTTSKDAAHCSVNSPVAERWPLGRNALRSSRVKRLSVTGSRSRRPCRAFFDAHIASANSLSYLGFDGLSLAMLESAAACDPYGSRGCSRAPRMLPEVLAPANADRLLQVAGLDSLVAVEVRGQLFRAPNIGLPFNGFLEGKAQRLLVDDLVDRLACSGSHDGVVCRGAVLCRARRGFLFARGDRTTSGLP
jgi:hypothetical protein